MAQTWWHTPIVPRDWKTETGSLELNNLRPTWQRSKTRKERKRASGHKGEKQENVNLLYD